MKTFDVKVNDSKVTVSIPTKLSEITKEWLNAVTEGINPAPNYSLVALVLKDKIGLLLNTKAKNNQMVAGLTLFVKSNCFDDDYLGMLNCGTPVVIAPSDIAMGNHIIAPKNSITPGKVASLLGGDKDIRNKLVFDQDPIYVVEFKLVPNSSIHGDIVEATSEFEDPFVKTITTDSIVLN